MEPEKKALFRQKSLDRISSPEQLGDYLRVANPSIWALLAAVILLIGGLFAWSMVGNLKTVVSGVALVENGQAQVMASDTAGSSIETGMTVRFGSDAYRITYVEEDEYGRTAAFVPVTQPDGRYDVHIVVESIHPIQFLFN